MSEYKVQPIGISADRHEAIMTIRWNDGHVSEYSFSLLRMACPCAQCQGGHEHMRSDPDPLVFTLPHEDSAATRIRSVEAVGTYAVTIEWEDGHHYGIYNWNYLRKLCPCYICRPDDMPEGDESEVFP
jgi:DUF971 family protein